MSLTNAQTIKMRRLIEDHVRAACAAEFAGSYLPEEAQALRDDLAKSQKKLNDYIKQVSERRNNNVKTA